MLNTGNELRGCEAGGQCVFYITVSHAVEVIYQGTVVPGRKHLIPCERR